MKRIVLALAVVAVLVGSSPATAGAAEGDPPPFSGRFAPPDADVVVRVRNLAQAWSALAEQPVGVVLREQLRRSEVGVAWARLAESAGRDPSALAEGMFGRDAIVVLRFEAAGAAWVVLSGADEDAKRAFASRAAKALGGGRFMWSEEEILFADRGAWLVLAGERSESLWREVLARLERAEEASVRVAEPRPVSSSARPAAAEVEAFLSASITAEQAMVVEGVIDANAAVLELRPASASARIDAGSRLLLDDATRAVLDGLRREHLAVVMTVRGVGLPFGDELLAALPELAPGPMLGRVAGTRRLWVLGESRGPAGDAWGDLRTPAVAHAIEVRDATDAAPLMRRWAASLSEAIRRRLREGEGEDAVLASGEGGSVGLRGVLEEWLGDHPLTARLSIDWGTAVGASGEWVVIASGAPWLRSISASLEQAVIRRPEIVAAAPSESARGDEGDLVQEGWIRTDRIARHLEGWVAQSDAFADEPARREFETRWSRAAAILGTVEEIRWEVRRMPSGWCRTSARIEMAPSE